jgi:TDG/mug DNA glycosylase family protein
VPEIVTPNEIAQQLAVTGLRFRNWLREQKAAGHPLVASHGYRTRYQFTRGEADQLAEEFAEQVLDTSAKKIAANAPPSIHTSRPGRAAARRTRPQRQDLSTAGSQVEHPRSDDPGHRVTVEWMGEDVETLADLLRSGLRAVAVGINPAPKSVAAGHYYQGNYGRTFFRRLSKAGLLPDGHGFDDDRSFVAGTGFTDIVKRATPSERGLRPGELEHGRTILEAKLITLDVPLVIFVFKSAAETLLGPLPPHSYGVVPRRRLGRARVFVMPGPTAASAIESDAIKKLKRALRAVS